MMDDRFLCEPCEGSCFAKKFCTTCQEYLCGDCAATHKKMKATKQHELTADLQIKSKQYKYLCDPCDRESEATNLCTECEEYLCDVCTVSHKKMKATKKHKLLAAEQSTDHQKLSKSKEKSKKGKTIPGKPKATEILSDSITLAWDPSVKFGDGDCYHISFKDLSGDRKWRQYQGEFATSSAKISELKSAAKYIFRVRVIHDDGEESPYSKESKEIKTTVSLAAQMLPKSKAIKGYNISPKKYALPLIENTAARNNTAKTKKFEVGTCPKQYVKSKTIMLVGATGTGKSTFVDGIINYVLGVSWDDPFRYTIVDLEREEKERVGNQAVSQTEWITCYTIYPLSGSRLKYQLNIIDTPGFGDTRGLTRDQEIVGQIRQLFSDTGPKGVTCIDAVCFLIKAPDARLTATQSYIFHSIMSLFGKDIEGNICSLITFADGNVPPVLAALKESKLPFGDHFTFNNSALFAENAALASKSLSLMFWNIGLSSFDSFFIHIAQMMPKSLQLTKDVLLERHMLEAIVQTLKLNLDAGLGMVEVLRSEKRVLEEHKTSMAASKDYVVKVSEAKQIKTLIPGRVHNTKCENCYVKCHPKCAYGDDEDKKKCVVMDSNGHCTICPDHCQWRAHKNDAYTYANTTVIVEKTLKELEEKYNDEKGKVLTRQQIVEKNAKLLQELTDNLEDMMLLVTHCNEKLKKIALKPNPLTMTEHIDLMIESERMAQAEGYMIRIKILNEFRKNAEVHKRFNAFKSIAALELGESTRRTTDPKRSLDIKSVIERATLWLKKNIPGYTI